jgi:hypothetical protein
MGVQTVDCMEQRSLSAHQQGDVDAAYTAWTAMAILHAGWPLGVLSERNQCCLHGAYLTDGRNGKRHGWRASMLWSLGIGVSMCVIN